MRSISALLLAALLVSCVEKGHVHVSHPAPVIPPLSDNQIVPGSRIGPISLGMTEADLLKYLGPPSSSIAYPAGGNDYIWAALELDAMVVGGVVTTIDTGSQTCSPTRYSTAQGLHVGSTELEVKVAMGSPAWRNANANYVKYCFPDETEVMIDGPILGPTAGKVRWIKVGGCQP